MIDIKKEDEKCPRCEMDNIMIGMAVAHVACGGIKNDDDRGECNEWAASLDPNKMSAMDIMGTLYDKYGIDGLSRFPELHTKMIRRLVISKVGEKLEKGIPITTEEQELFNRYTKEETKDGIKQGV
jgi:hypothetical protein